MKELLLIGTAIFALTSSSVTAGVSQGSISTEHPHVRGSHVSVATLNFIEERAKEAAEAERLAELMDNKIAIDKAIKELTKHVDKTWYVYSGSTPSGWDCSGLTMWFYKQLGIQLEHRASKQGDSGKSTQDPKPGDIVVFKYNGSKNAYHVGIYIGNGNMIHAPKHGHLTRVESIDKFAGNYSKVSYRTLIQTS